MFLAGAAVSASAARVEFDFSMDPVGQSPPGFASLVTGRGRPEDWKVVEEKVPPILAPLSPNAPTSTAQRAVLSVQSFNVAKDHLPLLLFTNEVFTDFTLSARFKITGGIVEPMAGLVFRAQDQNNYYVVRASTEGNLLWYRVVNGQQYDMLGIGVRVPISKDTWRELKIECNGSRIRCFLDGKLAIPPARPGAPTQDLAINDTTFSHGNVGFWTRADSQCEFVDAQVEYNPQVPYVQTMVKSVVQRYPHLLGLQIYAGKNGAKPVVIGSGDEHDLGTPGTDVEAAVIQNASVYYLKLPHSVEVILPLRDRNGEVIASLNVKMKSFPGETQDTAVARATQVKKAVETQMENLPDLSQ
jgi:hypothetical protein